MALLPLPTPDALQDKEGWVSTTFYRFLSSIESEARKTDRVLRFIDAPANNTYSIELAAPFGYKITKTSVKTTAGTCTVAFSINGVAIAGGSHSATTTLNQITRSSSNTVAVGNSVTTTISAVSTVPVCVGLVISIEYIRT